MKPPQGYKKALPGQVCKLNKSLYGLKQVDDILISGNSEDDIVHIKKALDDKFTIKDLGLARYFLGIELFKTDKGTYLNQRKYILDLLADAGLSASKPTAAPLPQYLKLSLDKGPDISYVVQHLSQFVSAPKDSHMQVATYLLRYLKGTISEGLFYPVQPNLQVAGFSDADWAYCLMTRKSLTGYCVFLSHTLVSWKTKKQITVSRSSTEAEYRSMPTTTCEFVWLAYLLKDLHIPVKVPITLFCDNKAAQQIAANPCFHERTKHLDIDSHFVCDKVQDGFIQTAYIPTHLQLADVMTKALGSLFEHTFNCQSISSSTSTFNTCYLFGIEPLTGTNFSTWRDQMKLTLVVMDLDHALHTDPPAALTDASTSDHKCAYEQWERSNRMYLMIIKNSIFVAIR
ncbi:uncharacterized mitochondrial protein AtMg00810-like [Rutidosis leptorrhynchoides]|uniref:uncharacterized mitochondrial protein AtMg00810-like n=1 Tax=Rutidosis leptorrhynchoides TaxID=125765 RepID=UPI003A9A50A3